MFNKFRKSTKPMATGTHEFLVVGLGNPGKEYAFTRHNAGFLTLDYLSDKLGVKINRSKFKALVAEGVIGDKRVLLMQPQTFMNNSGEAVIEAVNFYKIKPENVIVIFDDISLPVGKMRIRKNGSAGGHNGIKSIIKCFYKIPYLSQFCRIYYAFFISIFIGKCNIFSYCSGQNEISLRNVCKKLSCFFTKHKFFAIIGF